MYFPIFKLHGWGKRFAAQPQTIYSEVPKIPDTPPGKFYALADCFFPSAVLPYLYKNLFLRKRSYRHVLQKRAYFHFRFSVP